MNNKDKKPYLHRVLTTLTVGIFAAVALLVITNFPGFSGTMKTVANVFSSIAYGCIFAFLLNPLVVFIDRRLYPILTKRGMKQRQAWRISRISGVLLGFVSIGLLLYALISLIVPQLYYSIVSIIENFSTYFANAEAWVLGLLENNPSLRDYADSGMAMVYEFMENFLQVHIFGNIQQIAVSVSSSVYNVLSGLLDVCIGVIISIYILMSKDTFVAQAKKLTVAIWQEDTADYVLHIGRKIHKVFNGFVVGKLIDSLIMGVLAYIGLLIIGMPFPMLLATIIGATNVIPYFGPFIGAIPCAFLVLMVNPIQAVYFLIFILVLQQIDGNIIGPRVLRDNVGLSSFWILVSIIVGGGLFGFMGMLLGVPVFAVVYIIIGDLVSAQLTRKDKNTDTQDYYGILKVSDLPEKTEDTKENLNP